METRASPGPKEVILQLFVIVTLYVLAIESGVLLLQLINAWVPDVVAAYTSYWDARAYLRPLRHAIAMLIVFVPIHAWARRSLHRLVDARADIRALRSRRWLGVMTIAVAGLILAGDLVAVINAFLEGELTLRFILKAIAIVLIATATLWYERAELNRSDRVGLPKLMRAVGITIIALLTVGVIGGMVAVGTPRSARDVQQDDARTSALQGLQWEIVNYWQRTEALPQALDDLNDDIRGYTVPTDPETSAPYEYRALAPLTFELCANFTTDTLTELVISDLRDQKPTPIGIESYRSWQHNRGTHCFTRTIDPELHALKSQETPPVIWN